MTIQRDDAGSGALCSPWGGISQPDSCSSPSRLLNETSLNSRPTVDGSSSGLILTARVMPAAMPAETATYAPAAAAPINAILLTQPIAYSIGHPMPLPNVLIANNGAGFVQE